MVARSLSIFLIGFTGLSWPQAPAYAQPAAPDLRAQLEQLNRAIVAEVHSADARNPALLSQLAARRKSIIDLLRVDSANARVYLFDDAIRSAIVAAQPAAKDLLEVEADRSGELSAAVADDFVHGTSTTLYRLNAGTGQTELVFPAPPQDLGQMLHRSVIAHGFAIGSVMAVDSLHQAPAAPAESCDPDDREAAGSPSSHRSIVGVEATAIPQACTTIGNQRIAVLLLNFPGNSPAYPAGINSASFWKTLLTGSDPSLGSFLKEVSYGKTTLSVGVVASVALPQLLGCSDYSALVTSAFSAAAKTADLNQFNRFLLVFPATSCYFGGLGELGCADGTSVGLTHPYSVTWIPILPTYTSADRWLWNVLSHEFGHNLGLHHANTLDFGSVPLGPLDFNFSTAFGGGDSRPVEGESAPAPVTAVNTEYGDPFSVMGVPAYAGPYSGEHRARNLGWIPPTAVEEVMTPGTFELAPVEDATGLRALHVLRDASSNSWLWLEFHQPLGYYEHWSLDQMPGSNLEDGAQIHYESPVGNYMEGRLDLVHTYMLDMKPAKSPNDFMDGVLTAGGKWQDPYTPLTLEIGSESSSHLAVNVRYDPLCAKLALSAATLPPAGGADSLTIKAAETCSWKVSSNASWVTFTGKTQGAGSATVPFTAARNVSVNQRNSYITAGRQSLPLEQNGTGISIVSVSPNIGSSTTGTDVVFKLVVHNAQGWPPYLFFNLDLAGSAAVQGCHAELTIEEARPTLFLLSNDGGISLGAVAPGSASSVTSPSCTLFGSGSNYTVSGKTITVDFDLSFAPGFAGPHNITANATGSSSSGESTSGTIPLGVWTVKPAPAP